MKPFSDWTFEWAAEAEAVVRTLFRPWLYHRVSCKIAPFLPDHKEQLALINYKIITEISLNEGCAGASRVGSDFEFIRNHMVEASAVFLESPGRIRALMMILTLCLMIYRRGCSRNFMGSLSLASSCKVCRMRG